MWWLWPHLRRLWAAAGTVSAGLAVNYLYSRLGNQPAPSLSRFTDYLWRYRYWGLSALLAFAVASVFAERQFRKYEARAPRPLRTQGGPIRTLLSRFKLPARARAANGQVQSAAPKMVGRERELAQLSEWLGSVHFALVLPAFPRGRGLTHYLPYCARQMRPSLSF